MAPSRKGGPCVVPPVPTQFQHLYATKVGTKLMRKGASKYCTDVPRASEKEGQVRLDHSHAPTQQALLSPICFPRSKRPIAATRVTLDDSTPQHNADYVKTGVACQPLYCV